MITFLSLLVFASALAAGYFGREALVYLLRRYELRRRARFFKNSATWRSL